MVEVVVLEEHPCIAVPINKGRMVLQDHVVREEAKLKNNEDAMMIASIRQCVSGRMCRLPLVIGND